MRANLRAIRLFGEREFPEIEDQDHEPLELRELGVTKSTVHLAEHWLSLAAASLAEDQDAIVLAGLRAAIAIAKDLNYAVAVSFAMRDPVNGPWFTVDIIDPGGH
jgi:hypothetical protein